MKIEFTVKTMNGKLCHKFLDHIPIKAYAKFGAQGQQTDCKAIASKREQTYSCTCDFHPLDPLLSARGSEARQNGDKTRHVCRDRANVKIITYTNRKMI